MSLTYVLPTQESHSISLEKAVEMTTLYRENKNVILKEQYQFTDILALNETFNKEAIIALLQQETCVAFRIYYGMSEDLKVHAILVGVNEKGEDILPATSSRGVTEGDGEILEESARCPIYCPPPSPLNP
ncbi:MAG: hypothetical protein MUE72_06640 [Chitinophagaceae bacterium]|jgi:hypothetical protein|nr:hypothetical protein [Chitinophagaceae bacterium]